MAKWLEQEEKFLKENYVKMDLEELRKSLPDRTIPQIKGKAFRMGIKKPESNRGNSKHTINDKFFEKWTPESAWVYGIIMTDGHIAAGRPDRDERSLQFEFALKDIDILKQVRSCLEYTGLIHISKRESCRMFISNKKIINDLIALGIVVQDKTHNQKWPESIPDDMVRHLLRGTIDGDGSYYFDSKALRLQVLGTLDILENVVTAFNKIGVNHTFEHIKHRKKYSNNTGADIYVVRYSQGRAMNAVHWMYSDATLFSRRKFKAICDTMDKINGDRLTYKNIGAFLKLRELLEYMVQNEDFLYTTSELETANAKV